MGLEIRSDSTPQPRPLTSSAVESSEVLVLQSYTASKTCHTDLVMASLKAYYKESLKEVLRRHDFNFVLTDPRLPDHPIVYASEGFLQMSGYLAEEVLGRNGKFLQGPGTSRRAVLEIRDAIREEKSCQVAILNYSKQGWPFWNLLHIAPIFSNDGRVVHFVGVQTAIVNSVCRSINLEESSSACVSRGQSPQDLDCTSKSADMTESWIETYKSFSDSCSASSDHVNAGDRNPDHLRADYETDWVNEDTCEVRQADKEKVALSVKCVLSELVESSKCKGLAVTATRCANFSYGTGGAGGVCSSLMLCLTKIQQSFVLADPHLPDVPIVHASDMFLQLTGYGREEVVGRNCRFLQGPNTDAKAVQQIRESLNAEKPCTVRILNLRKDRRPFWNHLHIAPVRNCRGKVVFFVGVQLDITSDDEKTCLGDGMTPHMKQLGAIGAVRVAVRSLQGQGLRRTHKTS